MNRQKRQKLAAGAAVCALAIVATACSSSSSSGSTAGSNSSAANTGSAPSGSAINIGVIEPTNTSIYNAGDEVAAVRAAAAGINAQGGSMATRWRSTTATARMTRMRPPRASAR